VQFAGGIDARRVVQRDVFETQIARDDIIGIGLGDGRTGHFDAQQRGQAAMTGARIEERLVAFQFDAVGGATQGRIIPLQQGMLRRDGLPLSVRPLRRDPVAFAREGIGRQRDATRLRTCIQSSPCDLDAPDPVLGDPCVVVLRDPGVASLRETGVRPAGGEKLPAFSDAAPVMLRIGAMSVR
jgi:hypothetical protein